MTFEEWFSKHTRFGCLPDDRLTPIELAIKVFSLMTWNAAKEDSKPVAKIKYVDYMCAGFALNKGPYWTVVGTAATVIKQTKEQAEQWAIENGYRVADN